MNNGYFHNPVFSIVTVTYNAEKVLADTIQSVLLQTYKNVEYIIIDGASNDSTLAIINKYRPYIHTVVSEVDRGIYDAMNKGLAHATGDYICFLNAGDTLREKDILQKMVDSLTEEELPDVLYGQTAIVDFNRRFLHMRRLTAPEILTWKSFKQGMLVCHQAFFGRLTLAEPYNLQYRFSSDFDWCIRIMKKSKVLHNTHLTLIDYLDEGMTTANRKASLKERFRIMVRYYGWFSTIIHHVWFVFRLIIKPGQ